MEKPKPSPIKIEDESMPKWWMVMMISGFVLLGVVIVSLVIIFNILNK